MRLATLATAAVVLAAGCADGGRRTYEGTHLGPSSGQPVGRHTIAGVQLPITAYALSDRMQWSGGARGDRRWVAVLLEDRPAHFTLPNNVDRLLFSRTEAWRRVYGPPPENRTAAQAAPVAGGVAWAGSFQPVEGSYAGGRCAVRYEFDSPLEPRTGAYAAACVVSDDAVAARDMAERAMREIWRRPWAVAAPST